MLLARQELTRELGGGQRMKCHRLCISRSEEEGRRVRCPRLVWTGAANGDSPWQCAEYNQSLESFGGDHVTAWRCAQCILENGHLTP